jgi:hypothetical protein
MAAQPLPGYLWRISVCVIVFMIGLIVSSFVLPGAGLTSLMLSDLAHQQVSLRDVLMSAVALTVVLSLVATRLGAPWLVRWLIMSALTVVGFSANAVFTIAAAMPDTLSPAVLTVSIILSLLVPCLALSAVTTAIFPPQEMGAPWRIRFLAFFSGRSAADWGRRFFAAILSFVVIRMVMGLLVEPFTYPYHAQGAFELSGMPTGLSILLQFVRAMVVVLVCLPVVVLWTRTRTGLLIKTGLALYLLIGGFSMLAAGSLPLMSRVAYSAEILIDSLLFMSALILLLMKREALLAYSVQQRMAHR